MEEITNFKLQPEEGVPDWKVYRVGYRMGAHFAHDLEVLREELDEITNDLASRGKEILAKGVSDGYDVAKKYDRLEDLFEDLPDRAEVED